MRLTLGRSGASNRVIAIGLAVTLILIALSRQHLANWMHGVVPGKHAETVNTMRSIESALVKICMDAGVDSISELIEVEEFHRLAPEYAKHAGVNVVQAYIDQYTTVISALLKHGNRAPEVLAIATRQSERALAGTFDPELVQVLAPSYSLLIHDSWGGPFHFFVGPWPGEWGPIVFRCYGRERRTAYYGPSQSRETRNSMAADPLTVSIDGAEQGIPAEPSLEVYIWSNGANGVSDQPLYDPSHLYLPPVSSHYRNGASDEYMGGGDDINNWDQLETYMHFYSSDNR
ncbi:MAG: hypothetical protein KF886_12715 [Candidatus Hydrogenedentes bacterium]|nr:hypothetical protein [Candidatus Hydrogenedentota bacterium]